MASTAELQELPFAGSPADQPRLAPTFRVEIRRRHDETAPVEIVRVHARTIASARHAARLQFPDTVILSVTRV